ncbi:MAG: PQQ-binding-like beta-propeller repeat protein, partial [Parvularculaceae bacterium]
MHLFARAAAGICVVFCGSSAAAESWPVVGGDRGGQRYAEAAEITPANVDKLTPVWTYRTGHASQPASTLRRTKFQVTPILVENKLILCSPFNVIIALDPATGEELWRHDPEIDMTERPGNGFVCRGVAFWRDSEAPTDAPCAARVFTGTNDRRLVAVDAADGKRCASFGSNGEVAVDPEV